MRSLPGGSRPGPRGASRPGLDIMRHWFFHRFAWEKILWEPGYPGLRFWAGSQGTGALRKPGNRSGNPGSFPPMLPSPGRDAPLGLCDGVIFFFSTHSIGRRPRFYFFWGLFLFVSGQDEI